MCIDCVYDCVYLLCAQLCVRLFILLCVFGQLLEGLTMLSKERGVALHASELQDAMSVFVALYVVHPLVVVVVALLLWTTLVLLLLLLLMYGVLPP